MQKATVDSLKAEVCRTIDAMAPDLLRVSHEIHANPELAFHEHKAAALLTRHVEAAGLQVEAGAYGLPTAFAAEGGTSGETVAILSEYDALPGIGHSCGHNIIATTGLGASLALNALGSRLPGRFRYLGTPAEEKGGGKELMAQAGAFDGVDAAMMVHPAGVNLATMACLAISELEVTYHGKSAHASAMPHAGRNALDALVSAYQNVAQLRQHIRPSERVHGIFTQTGDAPNIVPDTAAGLFYVRAADAGALAVLKERVAACFEAGALATGCTMDLRWAKVDYLDLMTSWPLADAFQHNAETLGRRFVPVDRLGPSAAGSTDMGNVSHRVPSIHPMIASAPSNVVIHNPEFARWAGGEMGDEACLDGAKSLAMTALDFMTGAELRDRTRASFRAHAAASEEALGSAFHPDGVQEIGGCGCS